MKNNPPKKIFIDCGANLGQGLLQFNQSHPSRRSRWEGGILGNPNWLIYSFEANPFCSLKFLEGHDTSNVLFQHKAVWTKDEDMTLLGTSHRGAAEAAAGRGHPHRHVFHNVRLNLDEFYKGSSKEARAARANLLKSEGPVATRAFDFGLFLKNLITEHPDSPIYIKLDIEGAEYPVLEHLLKNHSCLLSNIDSMWIEFHAHLVANKTKDDNRILVNALNKYISNVYEWH
jgi:hypothetical protein